MKLEKKKQTEFTGMQNDKNSFHLRVLCCQLTFWFLRYIYVYIYIINPAV